MPSVGSSDIHADLETSYAATLGVLFLIPGLFALVVEPVLFVLADRYPRKWFVCGGLFVMAAAAFAAALAPSPFVLAAAIAVAWVGSGSGVTLAQATLVDAQPSQRERVLARWAVLGEIGDLGAPLLLAGLAVFGLGWRAGYAVVGGLVFLWALVLLGQRFHAAGDLVRDEGDDESEADDEEEPGLLEGVGAALRNRRLLLWLGATALCELLDELVVVFAVLFLRSHLGAGPIAISVVVGAGVVGALAGALLTDWLLARVAPLRLLRMSSVACLVVYVAWLLAPSVWLSAVLFAAVGVTAAPMYPIASAQAYAALPRRSGTVNAAAHIYTPITLTLPWVLGLVADAASVQFALALLLAQPAGLILVTLSTTNRRAS